MLDFRNATQQLLTWEIICKLLQMFFCTLCSAFGFKESQMCQYDLKGTESRDRIKILGQIRIQLGLNSKLYWF